MNADTYKKEQSKISGENVGFFPPSNDNIKHNDN